jgi:hypothetical protein
MKRRLLVIVLILLAFALASVLLVPLPTPPRPPPYIRLVRLTNGISPPERDYVLAMSGGIDHWTWVFEQTNRTSVHVSTPAELPGSSDTENPSKEGGIDWPELGRQWDTGKVYRVIGFYHPQGFVESELDELSDHLTLLKPLLPVRTATRATSQWVEVTGPSQLTNLPTPLPPRQ